MKCILEDAKAALLELLSDCRSARIGVAYFSPTQDVLTALKRVKDLRIVVSDEFSFSNPCSLKELEKHGAAIRCIAIDDPAGKLHAKVYITEASRGRRRALLGSANLTGSGLSRNREAGLLIDSTNCGGAAADQLKTWFDSLWESAWAIDWERAEKAHKAGLPPRVAGTTGPAGPKIPAKSFWILKTTEGHDGPSHWAEFRDESVIAVGWRGLKLNPAESSSDDMRNEFEMRHGFNPGEARYAANTLTKFANISEGDLILVTRGYPSKSRGDLPVDILGFARVKGPFLCLPRSPRNGSSRWRFRHPATVQEVMEQIPRAELEKLLGNKGSLMKTLHSIRRKEFYAVVNWLRENKRVRLAV